MATTFDFETALKQLQSGQALTGENGILVSKQLSITPNNRVSY
ncbi:hypothetical protein [Acinetobacter junii]|nr:hypothetical protein [Acinetobacter junii]ENV52058.1 hypothetical protein F953_00470 [Acinetobacter junii CIP 107470 = MTCC 11364]